MKQKKLNTTEFSGQQLLRATLFRGLGIPSDAIKELFFFEKKSARANATNAGNKLMTK